MAYAIGRITQSLRAAREGKGLSQRALARIAGVPQSHISKIESGAVDLRLSSLVEIARALDLDVTLVPLKNLSAVHAIVRDSRAGKFVDAGASAAKELRRLRTALSDIAHRYPDLTEVAQLQRRVRELGHFQLPPRYAEKLADMHRSLRAFSRGEKDLIALNRALTDIQQLRDELAHGEHGLPVTERVRPVYSLEEDGHG